MKPSKYRNKPTIIDGIKFDSKKEAQRWKELRLLEDANQIHDLRRQVRFKLEVNGQKICTYVADFVYLDDQSVSVVEDVKSDFTRKNPVYVIKKKMVKAIYRIEISEV